MRATYAQDQTWNVNNEWNYEFLGCSRLSTGFIECVMSAEYVGRNSQTSGGFAAYQTKAVTPEGREFAAKSSAAAGSDTTSYAVNVFQNVPVRVSYAIPYLKEFSTIRMLFLNSKRFDNVPVLGGSRTSALAGADLTTRTV